MLANEMPLFRRFGRFFLKLQPVIIFRSSRLGRSTGRSFRTAAFGTPPGPAKRRLPFVRRPSLRILTGRCKTSMYVLAIFRPEVRADGRLTNGNRRFAGQAASQKLRCGMSGRTSTQPARSKNNDPALQFQKNRAEPAKKSGTFNSPTFVDSWKRPSAIARGDRGRRSKSVGASSARLMIGIRILR